MGALLSLVTDFFSLPLEKVSMELKSAPLSLDFRGGGGWGAAAGVWGGGGAEAEGGQDYSQRPVHNHHYHAHTS